MCRVIVIELARSQQFVMYAKHFVDSERSSQDSDQATENVL